MSYTPKLSDPIALKDWYKDTGRLVKDVAMTLNIDKIYLSQINSGRIVPGEALKESFRKHYPGYDVIEMRAGVEEALDQPAETEAKDATAAEVMTLTEQETTTPGWEQQNIGKTIIYLLERDGDVIAYGSKDAMHQDIIYLAMTELGIKTKTVELR